MCSLDAEKAFDSCNWDILFNKLIKEKHIPLRVVKVLSSLYEKGTAKANYNAGAQPGGVGEGEASPTQKKKV